MEPDVEITAAATARRLRFGRRPRVSTHADESETERANLPTPVRPGVTYRGVRAATRLASRLRWR